jgi:ribosomal-protein-alanine N-acetyltransferase
VSRSPPHTLNPALATARLRLEPQGPEHAGVMMRVLADPRTHTFIPTDPPTDEGALRERFERQGSRRSPDGEEYWLNWIVFVGEEAVGTVQATVVPAQAHASVAYVFHPETWGRGYATEAVRAMLEHLEDLQIERLEAHIDTRNAASQRLVERLGFRRAEKIEHADEFKGSVSDEYRYELVTVKAQPDRQT